MPLERVEFIESWYERLVSRTNEKYLLPEAIRSCLGSENFESCLEIGLGTSPVFANRLADLFKRYAVLEKRRTAMSLPPNASLVVGDWESWEERGRYDVILASHVVYYFRDKYKAIQKMIESLTPNGRLFIVVNGKDGDYGPLKEAFSDMVGLPYRFTYDEVKDILKDAEYREHVVPSTVAFNSVDDLFETMRLSFDQYPEEYEAFKPQIIDYFRGSLKEHCLTINQRIFEVQKSPKGD